MSIRRQWRGLALAVFVTAGIGAILPPSASFVTGMTPAYAQVTAEFQAALESYGEWRRHPRWGEVWVPFDRPPGWRPYTYGRWVYTEDWGWYWVSDDEEADWGWVTYHYGRWIHDRGSWFWIPGDEWAPAWVDWRRGGDYVGWAPMPPDELVERGYYVDDPTYWIFVQPRYIVEPRIRTFVLSPQRSVIVLQQTIIVNRTVRLDHDRRRIAVNPGIAPGIVAAIGRNPIPTFHVRPHVISATHGIAGATIVQPHELRRVPRGTRGPSPLQVTIQNTTTVVQPVQSIPKTQPLRPGERGRLGNQPPRAAQNGNVSPPAINSAPPATSVKPPSSPVVATPTAPGANAPSNHQERRDEQRDQLSNPGAGAPQQSGKQQPPAIKPAITPLSPVTATPEKREERRDEHRERHPHMDANKRKQPDKQQAPGVQQIRPPSPPAARAPVAPAAPSAAPPVAIHAPSPVAHPQAPPATAARTAPSNSKSENKGEKKRPHKPGEKPDEQK